MSCTDCPDVYELCVNENSQRDYEATLKDKAGVVVPLAALTDILLTLRDRATGAVINDRDAVSVKNADGGTFHATSGLFTMIFDELDNVLNDETLAIEEHVATFTATWAGGDHQHSWDVIVRVKNLGTIEPEEP